MSRLLVEIQSTKVFYLRKINKYLLSDRYHEYDRYDIKMFYHTIIKKEILDFNQVWTIEFMIYRAMRRRPKKKKMVTQIGALW